MGGEKLVSDVHKTLIGKPHFWTTKDQWLPARTDLLNHLGQYGIILALWTADRRQNLEELNRTLSPALFGLADGGVTDEYYAANKPPDIPPQFELPFTDMEVNEYMHTIAPRSHHNPHIDERRLSIADRVYETDEAFARAVKELLLIHKIRHGLKVPNLVGSNVLFDDRAGDNGVEGFNLRQDAMIFGFNLVDPRRQHKDKTWGQWIDRITEEILSSL